MFYYKLSIVLVLLIFIQLLPAQDFKSDLKEQVPLVLKALNHNNTIKEKMRDNCVIAVLYLDGSATSEEQKKAITDVLNDNRDIKVHGEKIKVIEIPLQPGVNLEKKIIINKINAFWMASKVQTYMDQIRESARYNQVITISSDPDLLSSVPIAMGTQKTANGYKLVLNLQEAEHINLDLNQNLISEAIVLQPVQQ